MDIEEIKAFIKAGYSKEDIERLESAGAGAGAESGAGAEESAGAESGAESKAGASASEPPAGDDMAATIKALTETVTGLAATVKAMQDSNIKGASGGKPEKSGVEDVMKSFIDAL